MVTTIDGKSPNPSSQAKVIRTIDPYNPVKKMTTKPMWIALWRQVSKPPKSGPQRQTTPNAHTDVRERFEVRQLRDFPHR
jgi:hypothetical protein